ncbi:NAD(+) kinase [Magnetofaba australis]|uniref:NAD kinase n=1 Tax=Magnetofaba australis IT-1 TaxID=1434232 RepID=A0A1Y2K630_9PROT|nr:NAD(+) kinase [Magnetofaba australis]OSM04808.1 putative NAD(+) kinase [Magnetofaba australis IT-1]
MRNIGIIAKRSDSQALVAMGQLAHWLHQRGLSVVVSPTSGEAAGIPESVAVRKKQDIMAQGLDLMVVIGGDGTFIGAARSTVRWRAPLLGVNMGRLGFLTETPHHAMFETLEQVLSGHYRVESRTMLKAFLKRHNGEVSSYAALNDVVAHKGHLARMMEFQVSIDGQHVFANRADGLILATPTGSTAYAMSAGGPIIHPKMDAIVLTPICPHTLSNRPIVVPGNVEISIKLPNDGADRLLTVDGQIGVQLADGDEIVARAGDYPLQVIHPPERNYYELLRRKLRWTEQAVAPDAEG